MNDMEHVSGMELSRRFWSVCRPILNRLIPDIIGLAAVGLVGEGSECFGVDDNFSRDHDFGPGFCIWLPDDILEQANGRIAAAFEQLPIEFAGFPARKNVPGRTGVMSIEKFYSKFTGLDHPPDNWREWIAIPEERLAVVTNGEVFEDGPGNFTIWRNKLKNFYPEDVRLKKIATACMKMAQAGQYNLPRALKRGDGPAAMFAAARFAEAALSFAFLINKRYKPFYKWAPRFARTLPKPGPELSHLLEQMAAHPLRDSRDMGLVEIIEEFCAFCTVLLHRNDLSNESDPWLWLQGPAIMERVVNPDIRRLNLLEG